MGVIFANVLAIYRRELLSYFKSSLAYIVAGILWVQLGLAFIIILRLVNAEVASLALQRQAGFAGEVIDAPARILFYFFPWASFLVLFDLPLLSMNLYAEERKSGTLELLATSPISNWAVAVGKLSAVITLFISLLLPFMVMETMALGTSTPAMPLGVFLLGHVGLVLLAAAILAIGLFLSSLSDNVLVAAILTYALEILLWLVNLLPDRLPGILGDIMAHLSLWKHFTTLSQGIFSSGGVVLFLSYVVLGIFLTAQSIDLFRFQQ